MTEAPSSKICTECGQEKPLSEYSKAKTGRFGVRGDCKECRRAYNKRWFSELAPEVKASRRNPDAQSRYYQRNKDRFREYGIAWAANNKDAARQSVRAAMRRYRAKPHGKLATNVGRAVNRALRGGKGGEPSFLLLDFTIEQLIEHLERQFLPGMTWENYGQWHLDHIIPLAMHTFESPQDPGFKAAWSLTNLRPLWAKDNISKGARRLLLI